MFFQFKPRKLRQIREQNPWKMSQEFHCLVKLLVVGVQLYLNEFVKKFARITVNFLRFIRDLKNSYLQKTQL